MPPSLIADLLIILSAGFVAGLVCRQLRVPALIGYMLVGALIGPGGTGLLQGTSHAIENLAELGVFLLLFSIGLEFSLGELLRLGRHLVIGGSAQMLLVAVPVTFVLMRLDYAWQSSVLLASAAAFSSTVVVFKTLAEWGKTSSPSGRRAVGILLFQDAALVPLLLLIPMLTGDGDAPTTGDFLALGVQSACFIASVVAMRAVLARWLIPLLAQLRSPDLVVLAALVVLGTVTFASHQLGLPAAVGAFAAGLMLSGNRWTGQIDALVLPFREAFAAVFFVSLGLLLKTDTLLGAPLVILGLLVGLVVLKTVAATIALRLTGLIWRDSFAVGLGLAHIGEFAFVIVATGLQAGLLNSEQSQAFVAVALVSLVLSPFLLNRSLRRVGASQQSDSEVSPAPLADAPVRQAVIIGIGPIGRQLASRLETTGHNVCLVDRSPLNLHGFAQQGFRTVAGEATELETLDRSRVALAELVMVVLPEDTTALAVVRNIRAINRQGKLIVRCRYHANEEDLLAAGANHVVSEEFHAGQALLQLLTNHRQHVVAESDREMKH